jgi:hypothetical protein
MMVMTISDIVLKHRTPLTVTTKPNYIMRLNKYDSQYLWVAEDNYGKLINVVGPRSDTVRNYLSGYYYGGNFLWVDHDLPRIQDFVQTVVSRIDPGSAYASELRDLTTVGFPSFHNFPVLFYFTKYVEAKNIFFKNESKNGPVITWDIYDISSTEFVGKAVFTVKEANMSPAEWDRNDDYMKEGDTRAVVLYGIGNKVLALGTANAFKYQNTDGWGPYSVGRGLKKL